ncbi:TPA: hypothetical protein DCL30_03945 [Candidatus Peribacteria bacterium]|nr:MAG: hypothetical protein A3J91_01355 [Candidatus Peribacteria bacterium RIFOXYC2_FULL_58_10]OGJ83691.1 MAG: hypothetical protein A2529_01245 [Candidatus Peribacteria bacterium RIFOXYD2_FULL_58_15]HAI98657.1 hypothetical protein [Candidatus Peribacteria bacterium]HAS34370.1 hypothetical protein [Candidatus Peribacteria bacterium]
MNEDFSAERKDAADRLSPDELRGNIEWALNELRGHSALQGMEIIQGVDLIQDYWMEIAVSVQALVDRHEGVPTINLSGICDSFLCGMPRHPVLERIERMLDQQRMKSRLLAKWGPRRTATNTVTIP